MDSKWAQSMLIACQHGLDKRDCWRELPQSYEEAMAHTEGDTLMDFIVLEVYETVEGVDNPTAARYRAREALEDGIADIQAAINGLEQWDVKTIAATVLDTEE